MGSLIGRVRRALACGAAAACCAAVGVAQPAIGAESPSCATYAVRGVGPGSTLADVRTRLGPGSATELVRGDAGPQSGVTYVLGDVVVYVLYDRDVSSGTEGVVVLARARPRSGVADPVAFVRSTIPGLGEPALGGEHLSDGFLHGATVWEVEGCEVEVSAFRAQAEWWQPGKGAVFVQVASIHYADEMARRAGAGAAAIAAASGAAAEQPKPPEELELTLETAAAVPTPAPEAPVAAAAAAEPPASPPPSSEITDPVRLPGSYTAPRYPDRARRMKLQASVLLRVQVRRDGSVGEVGVLEATKKGMGFEQAAVDSVKRWRYRPATRDGKPEDAVITVRLEFD